MDFKMMTCFVLVILTACDAIPRDLSGKMFIFPREGNFLYVRKAIRQNFHAVTVCLRSVTDLARGHTPFSLSTIYSSNAFVISWNAADKVMELYVDGRKTEYRGLDYKLSAWHSVCTTWNAQSGLLQLWFDGQRLMKKTSTSGIIRGPFAIVVGQREKYYGKGYSMEHSFVGLMSDVHMWDSILSDCDIQKYMNELKFPPGNVLNWTEMDVEIAEEEV
uniref:Pentraxin family member n=1 Tax=Stegastes partitus TaxID=144197 RepID=A0A3B4Z7Z9_9TELE